VNEPDFTASSDTLSEITVAVLGLGLMGGSLGLALKGHCQTVLGYDPDPDARALARQLGAVERAASDPGDILPEADLVILAAPVRAILAWIDRLPDLHPGNPVVLDLGSTKLSICQALQALPARFEPVGGHPMCGKETSGIAYAEKTLYHSASFFLIHLPNSTPRACSLAEQLAGALGARPVWLDAAEHDRWTASTSHVPYLVACALAAATPLEASQLVGPGFRSTSRLAGSSTSMMLDILKTNRAPVLAALRQVRMRIDHLETLLADADEADLADWMEHARGRHRQLSAK
jgi:prephenate dehydrogenase